MRGAHRDAEARRSLGDRRIANRGNEETLLLKCARQVERAMFITDHPGNDRGAGFAESGVALREQLAQLHDSSPKRFATRLALSGEARKRIAAVAAAASAGGGAVEKMKERARLISQSIRLREPQI